jgi:transposase InsO family protein
MSVPHVWLEKHTKHRFPIRKQLYLDQENLWYVSFLENYLYLRLLVAIDICTRYCMVYFIKNKSVANDYMLKKCLQFRSDNVGEFKNKRMRKFCTARGTNLELTISHTPEKNGIVERKNRTAMESVVG